MPKTIHEKLRLKDNDSIIVVNAPKGFLKPLEPLPKSVKFSTDFKKDYNTIYWFVKSKSEVESQFAKILKALKDDTIVWSFYPKGTSGLQTDLTRDKGWEIMMKRDDLQWISMISFDETWTAFAFRKKTDADRIKESKTVEREIFKWADSKTKTLTLPDDISEALKKHAKAKQIFDAQSFSHRREYVEWIITAKREETRKQRLSGMIERLLKGFKNPAGRN